MAQDAHKFPYELADVAIVGIFDADFVPDLATMPDDAADPEQALHGKEMRRVLGLMLRELDPREELLLRMHYGIGVDEMGPAQIVTVTGLSAGQVRGALVRGMRRLRHGRRGRVIRALL